MLNLSFLPENPLYQSGENNQEASLSAMGWQLSPKPFLLSASQFQQLEEMGQLLHRFMQAIDQLYLQSSQNKGTVPAWVAELYNQGKPDHLLQLAHMKRLKSDQPLVIRPDLLLRDDPTTGEPSWTLCEIDAVPGGLGFTSALNQFYRKNGFPVLEAPDGMPHAFLDMLKGLALEKHPEKTNPCIVIVLSDESADYRAEMAWLVKTLQEGDTNHLPYTDIALIHPRQVRLVRDQLVFLDEVSGAEKPIDLIYRFFELFDLPNIPQIELIQYAVKKGLVRCTPPLKPHLEEKLSLALLHQPVLKDFWRQSLGQEGFSKLLQWVPAGWVVDPTPVPPQAVIPNLSPAGKPVQDFNALKTLSQKERQLVLKPSGFSETAWGSRGVTIGHDHAGESWANSVDQALLSFGKLPYIVQQFVPAKVNPIERLDLQTGQSSSFSARSRLCPYYFVTKDGVQLAGVLATSCPSDKKLIHGMRDAVLSPCMVG